MRKDPYKDLIFVKTRGYTNTLHISRIAKDVLGKKLAAIEWMDGYAFEVVMQQVT